MDFETKATNREELRLYAKLFRSICGFSLEDAIDPVALLDRLPDLEGFKNVSYEIVPDNDLPRNVPAQTLKTNGGFIIQIKESIYSGAYEKRTGGYRMHIIHEIMHVFADRLGFYPVFTRLVNGRVPPYKSLEWIVMALAGEVMMPYEATIEMDIHSIMSVYGVSHAAAIKRKRY